MKQYYSSTLLLIHTIISLLSMQRSDAFIVSSSKIMQQNRRRHYTACGYKKSCRQRRRSIYQTTLDPNTNTNTKRKELLTFQSKRLNYTPTTLLHSNINESDNDTNPVPKDEKKKHDTGNHHQQEESVSTKKQATTNTEKTNGNANGAANEQEVQYTREEMVSKLTITELLKQRGYKPGTLANGTLGRNRP